MSEIMKTPIIMKGKKGTIIHDKLCADGPVDPKTGEPLIDPETGEPYMGPNDDMVDLLEIYLTRKIRAFEDLGRINQVVPRFGVLSLVAMHTPIFLYDHPALKAVANTAFTDGINVFVDADFMRKLVEQEEESDGRQSGVVFLILHELMHKLYYHVDRLKNFPKKIANIAEDLVINGKLVKGFNTVRPVKLLTEIGYGMKPAEAEKYFNMAEEVVAEMLIIQERKKKKKEEDEQISSGGGSNEPGQGKGGSQEQGQGEGQEQSQEQSQGEEQEEENSNSQEQKGKSSPSQKNKQGQNKKQGQNSNEAGGEEDKKGDEEYSPIHHITPEELIDILEKNGLSAARKALDLPEKDDVEAIGKMKERSKMKDVDSIQEALSRSLQCGGEFPGQHIAEEASDLICGLDRGKITWKLAIHKHIMGDGQKLFHTDDEADLPWLLTKETMGVDPWYGGTLIPQAPDETVLILVDTSGSTGTGNMRRDFLQEALGLKRNTSSGDCARKVILYSADTVLRGEPLQITEANVEKLRHDGVPIFGNGGTDFKTCLDQALELPEMKKEKVKTVIYFTDCCDNPPSREDFEEHLNKGIKIVFITTPGMWNETWNASVSDWAEVYCIEEGTEVNLDKDYIDKDTRKNTLKK